MTPLEAKNFCVEFAKSIGPRGKVWISISEAYEKKPLTFCVYDNWPRDDGKINGLADTFEDATDQIKKLWQSNRDENEAANVKALALEIISTTDRKGSCSEADLRLIYRFNTDDIARLGEKACEVANRMAGRGPFTIQKTPSNGAPAMDQEAS
jgi:hypothetical protein